MTKGGVLLKGQLENIGRKEEVGGENIEVAVEGPQDQKIDGKKMTKKLDQNQPQVIEVATRIDQMVK